MSINNAVSKRLAGWGLCLLDGLKDFEAHCSYYHGVPKDQAKWGVPRYRIGLAAASRPVGPRVKYGDQPLVDTGPKSNWGDKPVAYAFVLKEKRASS
jgi:hypothetical protein